MNLPRNKNEILNDIETLVSKEGFLYTLTLALFEDFHINVYQAHEVDYRERLNTKEAAFLLGLLVKKELDLTTPKSPEDLISMKKEIYVLMKELHLAHQIPFFEKMKKAFIAREEGQAVELDEREFFGGGDSISEAIFYSGTGAYDVQYRDLIPKKYKYDKEWLLVNKNFDIDKVGGLIDQIRNSLQEKSKKVNFRSLRENQKKIIDKEELKEKYPDVDVDSEVEKMTAMMELYQYVELFFDGSEKEEYESMDDMREDGWKCFYNNLITLSIVNPNEFSNPDEIRTFLDNFTLKSGEVNKEFNNAGDYNVVQSHPVIKVGEDSYFVTNSFLLYEAAYESPFYWMYDDEKYIETAKINRGKIGEEIVYDELYKVFGKENTYKSIIVEEKKGQRLTDIDTLCVLGNYALCVQIKSKKLTLESWKGNDEAIAKDFKGAIQDGYDQGVVSRNAVLKRKVIFKYENGTEINLPEEIDQVFVLVVTTENFPSITHQASTLLQKKTVTDPDPLAFSIFDLEILVEYLPDPYDFLYYIRQRIKLVHYFKADEELVYLAYHLTKKLWPIGDTDIILIPSEEGLLIDRNYYPRKRGVEMDSDNDRIENRWKNEDFNQLCTEIKIGTQHKLPDILFHLFDMSSGAIEELIKYIKISKEKTQKDGRTHNFLLPPDTKDDTPFGITYMSHESGSPDALTTRLSILCKMRKYITKADRWLGIGSLASSKNFVDILIYGYDDWVHDETMEREAKKFYENASMGQIIKLKKVGRNEKCPCGSNQKYKKCCGK